MNLPDVVLGVVRMPKENRYYYVEKVQIGPVMKYNNNCGYICELCQSKLYNKPFSSQENERYLSYFASADIVNAFTHYTYQETNGNLMICDLQGVLTNCFSPLCLTKKPSGKYNIGIIGMVAFFRNHICGETCKKLELKEDPIEKSKIEKLDVSLNVIELNLAKIIEEKVLERCNMKSDTMSTDAFAELLKK